MKDESLDPYGIGMKLGEISSNIITIFKKLDSIENRMNELEGCHKDTREELRKMQGRQNGICEKKESKIKEYGLQIALMSLVFAVLKFICDFLFP